MDRDINLLAQLLKLKDVLTLFQVLKLDLAIGPAGIDRDGLKEVL